MRNATVMASVAVLGVMAVTGLARGNMLTNGGFDDNGGSIDGWQVTGGNVTTNLHTTHTNPLGWVTNPVDGTHFVGHGINTSNSYGALYQTVAVASGVEVTVDFSWKTLWNLAAEPAYVAINNTSSAPSISGNFFKGLESSCEYVDSYTGAMSSWAHVSETFDSAGYITVSVFTTDNGASSSAAYTAFDAVSVTPEPATIGLLCVGAAGMLKRRNR